MEAKRFVNRLAKIHSNAPVNGWVDLPKHHPAFRFLSGNWFTLFVTACCMAGMSVISNADETNRPPAPPLKLCVATFNLRFASKSRPNSWAERRPVMRDCLRRLAPDVMGTQEGLHQQLKDIAFDLPDYDWIGTGRDGGDKGEFMAVFFRRDRFEALSTNHFWLSDTPEVVASSTWGNSCRRMVTAVRFRERSSGREFHFWNTHLDHEAELAREKGAQLILKRIEALKTGLPLLLVGDFNCASGRSSPYNLLVKEGGFTDTWNAAATRVNESFNTFHGFENPGQDGVRIDWILARGMAKVERAEIVKYSEGNQYPSDHFPVASWLLLP